ncbi:amino acid transporter, partial [Cryobacterium sp. Hz7]
ADVNAQAGAYATGILAMMVSGAIAVTISAIRRHQRRASIAFTILTLILLYALGENILEKPDGIAISAFFILGIIVVSLVSRVSRTTELRVETVELDEQARRFITDSLVFDGALNLIATKPKPGKQTDYAGKETEQRGMNPVPGRADVLFLEIEVVDPSSFSETLHVRGEEVNGLRVLRAQSPAAPNAIAAILLALRDASGVRPHAYFEWSEGNPLGHLLRYLLLGQGDTAPVVREILRQSEADPARRPGIHVGGG